MTVTLGGQHCPRGGAAFEQPWGSERISVDTLHGGLW